MSPAMSNLFLASSSPRRAQLLEAMGFDFSVLPSSASSVDETPFMDETPGAHVARLARAKAERALSGPMCPPQAVVLSGDTVVTHAGRILGKPRDATDACRMLADLSGTTHHVLTAIAVADREHCAVQTVRTTVELMPLSAETIADYVASGEPLDKAGAYALQGLAAQFVVRIEGSWGAVVGLPQHEVAAMLGEFGLLPRWRTEQISIERSR